MVAIFVFMSYLVKKMVVWIVGMKRQSLLQNDSYHSERKNNRFPMIHISVSRESHLNWISLQPSAVTMYGNSKDIAVLFT